MPKLKSSDCSKRPECPQPLRHSSSPRTPLRLRCYSRWPKRSMPSSTCHRPVLLPTNSIVIHDPISPTKLRLRITPTVSADVELAPMRCSEAVGKQLPPLPSPSSRPQRAQQVLACGNRREKDWSSGHPRCSISPAQKLLTALSSNPRGSIEPVTFSGKDLLPKILTSWLGDMGSQEHIPQCPGFSLGGHPVQKLQLCLSCPRAQHMQKGITPELPPVTPIFAPPLP